MQRGFDRGGAASGARRMQSAERVSTASVVGHARLGNEVALFVRRGRFFDSAAA